MTYPKITRSVPTVTADQMAEVDRLAVGPYGIALLQMMELAGRGLARVVHGMRGTGTSVTVVAGGGGNGGGAMAAARRLSGFGLDVTVVLDREPARLTGAAAHQAASLEAIGIRPATAVPGSAEVIVDGLIGYGLTDAPSGKTAELIAWVNAQSATVISLDVPSGVDATTGYRPGLAIDTDVTVTLALPKSGLIGTSSHLLLADIAIPPVLWTTHFGLETAFLFADSDIVDVSDTELCQPTK
jgi:NAD(P)H-hydrate epimerase